MKNAIAGLVVAAALLAAAPALAQGEPEAGAFRLRQTLWSVNYEMSAPLGSMTDYIDSGSWRGWSIDGRYRLRERLSAGFAVGFNRFEQVKHNLVLEQPAYTASGTVYRYFDKFSLMATGHYYLLDGAFQPYLGVGLGGVWTYAYSQIADLSSSDNGFDFIAAPEVGCLFTLGRSGLSSVGLNASVRYTFTTASFGKVDDAQFASVQLGAFWFY